MFQIGDILSQKIYDTAVRTLKLCIHEPYEDIPWREQSLYCFDSRNQMLCGYYAFQEFKFAIYYHILKNDAKCMLEKCCMKNRNAQLLRLWDSVRYLAMSYMKFFSCMQGNKGKSNVCSRCRLRRLRGSNSERMAVYYQIEMVSSYYTTLQVGNWETFEFYKEKGLLQLHRLTKIA